MAASQTLEKNLTLFDVYAISTGAMFSSGFFLLPGIAAAETGPSVVLAYFVAGLLILPAMLSLAELSTAMPKSGGTYYFLDRSLGPLAGTVGGLGTWLALVFKSAFALIGMGAYLVIWVDLPVQPVAIALTVAFTAVNIIGAKESSGLQRLLVSVLLGVLTFYIVEAFFDLGTGETLDTRDSGLTDLFPFGLDSFLSTIGLVFVSYAGLTKATSVAEEVKNPDRNLPLGMALSLLSATLLYALGVFVMVVVLEPSTLYADLTPVYTAGAVFMDWLPWGAGLMLVVVAALAAFASTGNAGIMAASRYPLAMARDRLVPSQLADLGRFGTPVWAVLLTGGFMLVAILVLPVQDIAKLASAFQLLVFGCCCLAVIIMRESRIPTYAPGFRSPLYPWTQLLGLLISGALIIEMGLLAIRFTGGIVVLGVAWYMYYAQDAVIREGAIYHLFARLGQFRHDALDLELQDILEEKGVGDASDFDKLVARASVIRLDAPVAYDDVVHKATEPLAARTSVPHDTVAEGFLEGSQYGSTSVSHGAALAYFQIDGLDRPELVMVHCQSGTSIEFEGHPLGPSETMPVYAVFLLLSPRADQNTHLNTLASIANRVNEEHFLVEWRSAVDDQEIKETLLHHDRYLTLHLLSGTSTQAVIGRAIEDLTLPSGMLVALIRRQGDILVPEGSTVLQEGDRITIIGQSAGIKRLRELYDVDVQTRPVS
jgi:amino acid transporter/mannitol/fructose-specific phosphotransferase system IIA component (Ntr-type)